MTKNPKNSLHTFVILAYKESPFLESCLKSVVSQNSSVIVATTTPNSYINNLAKKYKTDVVIGKHTTIGGDFNFALNAANTPLVTIAHQDDIYEKDYSVEIIKDFRANPNSSIIFTDYYEIRNQHKTFKNTNLIIKRLLLLPLKCSNGKLKRSALRFGCAISCPSVTFVKKNCPQKVFATNLKCNVDWQAWEALSLQKNPFSYISKPLMGHRISSSSTTTKIINQGLRTKEDYEIFRRFWPKPIAKLLTKIYQKSEKSNSLKTF